MFKDKGQLPIRAIVVSREFVGFGTEDGPCMADKQPLREPISAKKRQQLQQCFLHAGGIAAKGDFDYATKLLTTCVAGDPGNLSYAQSFVGNLQKKYNNNKKGSRFAAVKGATAKGGVKRAQLQKDWPGVIKAGLGMLELNPWDSTTLIAMSKACEELEYDECELLYLRTALDANMKDPELNRRCGRVLARQEQFDQAIVCWTRVQQALPEDEEAKKAIGDLTVNKTIHQGGYEAADSAKDVKHLSGDDDGPGLVRTPEEQFEKAIKKDPDDTSNYLQLADLHLSNERFEEAEKILRRALEVSGEQVDIRERLEDVELRMLRERTATAERSLKQDASDANKKNLSQLRVTLNKKELEVYRSRSERFPTNLGLRYKLGLRMKRAQKYNEAIKELQEARGDARRKGDVLLALGECFQQIKQYKLALSNYQEAVESLSEREMEQKKLAIYRVARLAWGLKDVDTAEKYATDLAGYDFSYRDVSELLDKIRAFRENA